jgi:hypothetical protein
VSKAKRNRFFFLFLRAARRGTGEQLRGREGYYRYGRTVFPDGPTPSWVGW